MASFGFLPSDQQKKLALILNRLHTTVADSSLSTRMLKNLSILKIESDCECDSVAENEAERPRSGAIGGKRRWSHRPNLRSLVFRWRIKDQLSKIDHSFLQSGGLLDHRNARVECLIPSRLSCRMFSRGKLRSEAISGQKTSRLPESRLVFIRIWEAPACLRRRIPAPTL